MDGERDREPERGHDSDQLPSVAVVILMLAVLAVVGIEVLRRQTAQEFPPGANSS